MEKANKNAPTVGDELALLERELNSISRINLPNDLRALAHWLEPPSGHSARVTFEHADKKHKKAKIRTDRKVENLDRAKLEIRISFEASGAGVRPEQRTHVEKPVESTPLGDLIRGLERAEKRVPVVVLKWFRDTFLSEIQFEWSGASQSRYNVLSDAINRGWILTNKVHNPKAPQFPVTAIRLNRHHPDVQKILGGTAEAHQPEFVPITIPGEGLSDTILRERR